MNKYALYLRKFYADTDTEARGKKGDDEALQAAIDAMEDAISSCEDVESSLEEAQE